MNALIEIDDLELPEVKVFSSLTESQLRNDGKGGILIAESPKVINTALDAGYEAVSLLCERKHIAGDAAGILKRCPTMPVYTGSREILARLTGYKLTRGVLCAMKRKPQPEASEICSLAKRVVVIENVCDTTNIGAIFRSAAALGIDGILLTPESCDPFNRRAIRVSMGAVFRIRWAFTDNPVEVLKENDFTTVALTLHKDSVEIDDSRLKESDKLAMVVGTEGEGLSEKLIAQCDYKAIIPMHHNIDSLNVGAAAAIAFWELRRR